MRPEEHDRADDIHSMMRKLYPCRLVERDGEVVGAWLVVSNDTGPSADGKGLAADVEVRGFVRTPDGVAGLKERLPLHGNLRMAVEARLDALAATVDPAARGKSHEDFCECVRIAAWQVNFDDVREGKRAEGLAMSVTGTLNTVLRGRVDQGLLRGCVAERMDVVSERLDRALEAFDPDAIATLLDVTGHDAAIAGAWPGLDRGFDPDAPLVEAIIALPKRVPEIVMAWHEDPGALARSLAVGILDQHLSDRLAGTATSPVALASLLPAAARALAKMEPATLDSAFGDGASKDMATCVTSTLSLLDGYGPGAEPKHAGDWRALVELAPLLGEVETWSGLPGSKPDIVPMPRGPAAALRGIRDAAGKRPVETLLGDLDTLAIAFSQEIAIPAATVTDKLATLPSATDEFWLRVSRDALFSGQPLHQGILTARRWHSARKDIARSVATIDARTREALSWQPGIPDGRVGELNVVVAKCDADLRRIGHADEGIGLDVMSSGRACVAGTRRIILVEGMRVDGTRGALSCHLLGIGPDGVRVIDDKGRRGSEAPEACRTAAARYAAGVSRAYAGAVTTVLAEGRDASASRMAYDVSAKTWSDVRGIWSERIAGRSPWSSAAQLTTVALAHAEGLRTSWSAKAFEWADPALRGTETRKFIVDMEMSDMSRPKKEAKKAPPPAPGSKAAKRAALLDNVPTGRAQERLAMAFEGSPFLRGRRVAPVTMPVPDKDADREASPAPGM